MGPEAREQRLVTPEETAQPETGRRGHGAPGTGAELPFQTPPPPEEPGSPRTQQTEKAVARPFWVTRTLRREGWAASTGSQVQAAILDSELFLLCHHESSMRKDGTAR